MHIVSFFNKSTCKWLPQLRGAMNQHHRSSFSLLTGVVTRWTKTWMSRFSVLRAKCAFELVFILHTGDIHKIIDQHKCKGLNRAREITMNCEFWPKLSNFLYIRIPTVESSLILQSSRAKIEVILYCYGRKAQMLSKCKENAILEKLEKLFSSLELPLLFSSFMLHPNYVNMEGFIFNNDIITISQVTTWIMSYGKR